jgi:hypothetical protein
MDDGAGKPIDTIPPVDRRTMLEHVLAVHLLYMVTLWLCRISGLAFYARIGKNVVQLQKILAISWVVVSLTLVAQLLLIALQCIPLEKLLNPLHEGKCISEAGVLFPTLGTSKSRSNRYTLALQG